VGLFLTNVKKMSDQLSSSLPASSQPTPRLRDPAWRSKAAKKLEEEFQLAVPMATYYDPPRQARVAEMDSLLEILNKKIRVEAALAQINADLEQFMRSHPQQVYSQMRDAALGATKKKEKKKEKEDEEMSEEEQEKPEKKANKRQKN
jgi:hypothetical protein